MPNPKKIEDSLFASFYFRPLPQSDEELGPTAPPKYKMSAMVKLEMDSGPCCDVIVDVDDKDKKTLVELLTKYRDRAISTL